MYLFGSALTSATPSDVDIIAVYGEPLRPAQAGDALRPVLTAAVEAVTELPAHILLFSEQEAMVTGVLSRFGPVLIAGSTD